MSDDKIEYTLEDAPFDVVIAELAKRTTGLLLVYTNPTQTGPHQFVGYVHTGAHTAAIGMCEFAKASLLSEMLRQPYREKEG